MNKSQDLLNESDMEDSLGQARVTIFLDIDVLKTAKKNAKDLQIDYQTYLNNILREVIIQEDSTKEKPNH